MSDASPIAAAPSLTEIAELPPAILVDRLSHAYPASKPSRRRRRGAPAEAAAPAPPAEPQRALALDAVSLSIHRGEIFGILGPNGSGKTTLFRILATVLSPANPGGQIGHVTVLGRDVLAEPDRVRQSLGVVFQSPSLDGKLTARENLLHQGHLYGLSGGELHQRIDSLLDYFGLTERRSDYVEHFSGGMRRRVELAKALLHEPKVLLLDEPATGLDPGARHDLWRQLQKLRSEREQTVALTTHLMDEADRCDRLAVLSRGKVVAVDTPANLKARIGGDVITLTPRGAGSTGDEGDAAAAEKLRAEIAARFAPWDQGAEPTLVGGRIRLEKREGASFIATLTEAFPGRFDSITVGQPTLEDVFLHLTGHTLWEERGGGE
jgi:ABC-2 type transport system ATP-binding protein